MRQLLDWKDEVANASEFVDRVKDEVFEDRVYVFTPEGKVIDLPAGATPIDFAYAIHTEVGHRCRGAKVNGRIVPLTHALKTGEQVEILTARNGGPSRDWLRAHLGYVKTSRARSGIQKWFRAQHQDETIASGRHMLEREMQRMGVGEVAFDRLARKLGLGKVEEMFVRLADGDLKMTRVISAAQSLIAPERVDEAEEVLHHARPRKVGQQGFEISGVGNLLTSLAACCNPLPGDAIVGYITRNRGVTVHRQDCRNALRLRAQSPERLVEVNWTRGADAAYPVQLAITAYDRQGLLRDITGLLADAKLNVLAVNTSTDKSEHIATLTLTVEVADIQSLSQVMARINQLPNVIDVRRVVS